MIKSTTNGTENARNIERYENEPFAKSWPEFWLIVCAAICGLLVGVVLNYI